MHEHFTKTNIFVVNAMYILPTEFFEKDDKHFF